MHTDVKTSAVNKETSADFDLRDIILNSETFSTLMERITFSFDQSGEKKKSTDGKCSFGHTI